VRPSGDLSEDEGEILPAIWREVDTLLCALILLLGIYLAAVMGGLRSDVPELVKVAREFLGFTAPVFLAAGLFIAWVSGALMLDVTGFSPAVRRWNRIAGGLYYVENAAPFVGLLECFISIVKALLAYSAAGATPQAQSAMIASIAVALGASAAGCFVALCANSLRTIVNSRIASASKDTR
jgi:hypothetical protein